MRSRAVRAITFGFVTVLAGMWPGIEAHAHGGIHPGELWVAWDGEQGAGERAFASAIHPTGRLVYVTGDSYAEWLTVAYQAGTGRRAWATGSPTGMTAWDVAVDPDGSAVFVTGTSYSLQEQVGYLTTAYDAWTGATLWTAAFDPEGFLATAIARSVAVSPDGTRVYVTGDNLFRGPRYQDYLTIAYDAASGARLWVSTYDGGWGSDFAQTVRAGADGTTVYVTGWGGSPTGYENCCDVATVAIDAGTGSTRWVARLDAGHDISEGLAVTPDGLRVLVTSRNDDDYVTVAYGAPTGQQLWLDAYDGGFGQDGATELAVSPDSSTVYVTGESQNDPSQSTTDWATIAYEAATGARRWVARLDDPGPYGDTKSSAIAVSPDGSLVYVAGSVQHANPVTGDDYLTLAYDAATGQVRGSAGFGTDQHDHPIDLVVAADGARVFVTGTQDGYDALEGNYVTAAYERDEVLGAENLFWAGA